LILLPVENVAFQKETWMSSGRQVKRHAEVRPLVMWRQSGGAGKAVDGRLGRQSVSTECTLLDNYDVDRPVWLVDIGRRVNIAGVVINTWLEHG